MDTHAKPTLLAQAEQKFGLLNSAEKKLFTLAQEKFEELWDSEYELFRAIANGEPKDYRIQPVEADDNKPENATNWGAERVLRSDRIRWLCVDSEVWKLCLPQGINISGAKIGSSLNLSFSDVEIPLRFFQCYFGEALLLQQANLRQLDLSGTCVAFSEIEIVPGENRSPTSIDARFASITGSILLSDSFWAKGTISLAGVSIGGNLDCSNGKFTNKRGDTLFAQSINVKGSVFLSSAFKAEGTVNLYGAIIGNTLDCCDGEFTNETGDAIFAQSASVTASVFLSDGFESKGMVDLCNATIGGSLVCSNGKFTNTRGDAIFAQSISVKGSVLLSDGFEAEGIISLLNTQIGHTLKIAGISNRKGTILDLRFTQVQTLDHAENSFPIQGNLKLDGLVYETLRDEPLNNGEQHLQWLRLQPRKPFSSQPYEQLAKVLQSTGKGDEAVQVLIGKENDQLRYSIVEKLGDLKQNFKHLTSFLFVDSATLQKDNKNQLNWLRLLKSLDWFNEIWKGFLGITIAYGYRPDRALLWALVIIVFGAFIFSEGYSKGLITPTEKDCESAPLNEPELCFNNLKHPKFDPIIYSLDVFLPIIDLRLKSAWLPNANKIWQPDATKTSPNDGIFQIKSGAQLRYYFWFQIISGWVLTTLWVAGFTGLVRNTNK